ncbi:MAG: DUF2339 domain-containing protein [Thermomicrobiales bacterium]
MQYIENTVSDLDQRLRLVEERVPGIETAPSVSETPEPVAVPVTPIIAEPPAPVEPVLIPLGVSIPEPASVEEPIVPEIIAVPEQVWQPVEPLFPPLPQRERTEFDLEDLLSGRVLAWTGGLAILVGSIFFLSLAFSRGWIGPSARIVIGMTAATVMLSTGAWFFERRERIFGHVMVATGLGVMNIALLAATRLYDLVSVPIGLLAILVSAMAAAVIAVRASSQIVAGYGLIAALVAPPLLGAQSDLPTAFFVGTILIGTTSIALFQTWRWLPPLAFFLAVPQVSDLLVSDINAAIALLVLTGFWSLNAIAAGGEEFRVPSQRIRVTSATLLMINAVYLVGMGFVILDGDLEPWRGLFLVGAALGHGLIGLYFLRDRGEYHPFGMLAAGTGVAAFTMAIPVQFGGPVVPVGWAAEAAALAWIFGLRKHRFAGVYATVLGILAITHLLMFEYPFGLIASEDLQSSWPFLNANGSTLAFLLAALAVSGYFIAMPQVRTALAFVGLSLIVYAVPYELSGVAVVAAWTAVAVALAWIYGHRQHLHVGLYAVIPAALAIGHLALFEYPLEALQVGDDLQSTWPFLNLDGLGLAMLLAAAAISGYWITRRIVRVALAIAAMSLAMYAIPFELSGVAVLGTWSAIFVLAIALQRWPVLVDEAVTTFSNGLYIPAIGAAVLSILHAFTFEMPLSEIDPNALPDIPFTDERTLAAMFLIAAAGVVSTITRHWQFGTGTRVAAFAIAAYLMIFELSHAGVVVMWSALAIGLVLLSQREPAG